MNHFYHIGINYAGTAVRPQVIDSFLSPLVDDWIRYSPCCWLVWTGRPATEILEGLKPHISLSDSILIARVDLSDRAGFMPRWAWEWMDQKRGALPIPYSPPSVGAGALARAFQEKPAGHKTLGEMLMDMGKSPKPTEGVPTGGLGGLGGLFGNPKSPPAGGLLGTGLVPKKNDPEG